MSAQLKKSQIPRSPYSRPCVVRITCHSCRVSPALRVTVVFDCMAFLQLIIVGDPWFANLNAVFVSFSLTREAMRTKNQNLLLYLFASELIQISPRFSSHLSFLKVVEHLSLREK